MSDRLPRVWANFARGYWHHHEYSRQIVEGTVENDAWFAYMCGLDDGDDFLANERCWIKANPNLGVSVTEKYVREQVEEARGMPSKANIVKRLNGCVWTQSQTRYYDVEAWRSCGTLVPDAALVGRPCYGGLDLGKSDDFSAFALIWLLEDGRVVVRMKFWIPQIALEHHPHRPYDQWRRAGVLEGDATDLDIVERDVTALCEQYSVRQLGYDDYAEQMRQHLEGAGITMVKVRQGYGLNEALVRVHALVVQQRLCHGGNPILTWMADNMVVRHGSQGEIRPDKERAAEKIDGQVALMTGYQCLIHDVDVDAEISRDFAERGLWT